MSRDADISAVLDRVLDPCSVAAGRPLGLVEMGLVLGWRLDRATLYVTLCTTSGACMMAPHFIEAARDALLRLAGVDRVEIAVDHAFLWTPARMPAPPRSLAGLVPFAARQPAEAAATLHAPTAPA